MDENEAQVQEDPNLPGMAIKVPEVLCYSFFEHNRYSISSYQQYESLCNNGFIKLYTPKTKVYWHTQNEFGHETPDWKFHFSIRHEDLRQAWDLLVGVFVEMNCRSGLKVLYLRESCNPVPGRQITLYIVRIVEEYKKSLFAGDFHLSISEEHSEDFWVEFVERAQGLLRRYNIQSNGLAHGDLQIGEYCSLRNEAFVTNENGDLIYPPNQYGWNHLNQQLPFRTSKFRKKNKRQRPHVQRPMYYFMLPIFMMSAGLYFLRRNYVFRA